MKKPLVIGIAGFKSSGKNTTADFIIKYFKEQNPDIKIKEVSLANHLKNIISVMFMWPRDMLEGITLESREWRETPDPWWSKKLGKDFTPRYAMQFIGTDLLRNQLNPEIWVMSLERQIDKEIEEGNGADLYLVTDVRFADEINWVRSMGGFIVETTRNDPDWYNEVAEYNRKVEKGTMVNIYSYVDSIPEICKTQHPSEWAFVGLADFKLPKADNLEVLEKSVREFCESKIKDILK